MAEPGAEGPAAGAAGGGVQWGRILGQSGKAVLLMQLVTGVQRLATQGVPPQSGAPAQRAAQGLGAAPPPPPVGEGGLYMPRYRAGMRIDVHVWVNAEQNSSAFAPTEPAFSATGLSYGAGQSRSANVTLAPDLLEVVKGNGTLWTHAVVVPAGFSPDPNDTARHNPAYTKWMSNPLVKHLKVVRGGEVKNLLDQSVAKGTEGEGGDGGEEAKPQNRTVEYLPFLKPNITVSSVTGLPAFNPGQVPPQFLPHLDFDAKGNYKPIVMLNDFWILRDYLIPVNATTSDVTINVDVNEISIFVWQLYLQFEQSFQIQTTMGLASDRESDEMKRMFLEGNPYLLALTFFVSLLHTVFDMLAFKNDVGFWRKTKSMVGLSARTVVINCFCQTVIFLYLVDNDTSMVVLFSSGLGLVIEYWKLTKAMKVKVVWRGRVPTLSFTDRDTYAQSETKKHDAEAMRYLSYALYPLVFGYAVYSLMYKSHKSWYSWVLNSLVGAVYTFGFILMCPQLYINYKLKSVAHLPWRQMTYKFLNTIIDDLFAFVIKMPTMHRLSVFRDDLIFCVYLYQRWAYRVDKSRVNEYGFTAKEGEEKEEEGKAGGGTGGPGGEGGEAAGGAPKGAEGAGGGGPDWDGETKKDK